MGKQNRKRTEEKGGLGRNREEGRINSPHLFFVSPIYVKYIPQSVGRGVGSNKRGERVMRWEGGGLSNKVGVTQGGISEKRDVVEGGKRWEEGA